MNLIKALKESGYRGIYIIEVDKDVYTATAIPKDDPMYNPCRLALEEAKADIAKAESIHNEQEPS